MNTFLVDTSIFVDYLRGQQGPLKLFENPASIKASVITLGELFQGARDKKALVEIKYVLSYFAIIPIDEEISKQAIELLEDYHLSHGLLLFDAFLAATSLEYGFTLLTGNFKHFQMIKGLKVKKW